MEQIQDGSTAQDSSLEQQQTSDSSQPGIEAGHEEKVPWNQDPRWLEWRKEEKTLRETAKKASEYESELNNYKQFTQANQHAVGLWNVLQQDQQKLKQVIDIVLGNNAEDAAPTQDPYAEYDPTIAQKLRDLDQLKEYTQRLEQDRVEGYLHQNQQELEKSFFQMCAEAKITNNVQQEALGMITLSALQMMMPGQELRTASAQQLQEAFKTAYQLFDGFRKAERQSLSLSNVPPSGSKTGAPARMETWGTDRERHQELLNALF